MPDLIRSDLSRAVSKKSKRSSRAVTVRPGLDLIHELLRMPAIKIRVVKRMMGRPIIRKLVQCLKGESCQDGSEFVIL